MLKYSVLLYCLLATVSGQLQNQSPQVQSLSAVDQPQASQGVTAGLANSANLKSCRRRNNVENSDVLSPDASLLQRLYSQSVHPLNQKLSDKAEDRLAPGTPESLNAYTVTIQQDPNILVQKDTYIDPQENDVPLISRRNDAGDLVHNENELCQKSNKNENEGENDDEQNHLNTDSKHGSSKVHKQVLELLSKCAQKEKEVDDDDVNDENEVFPSRRSYNELNENKLEENRYSYEPSKLNEESGRRKFRTSKSNANEVQIQPKHPAQGEGISNLADSKVLLLNNRRVCFACTTTNDPSCWNPDQTTTVKYCKKEDDACITKTYKAKNELITVRDCGNSCTDNDFPGVPLRYKSCRICHSDQCNSADALTSLNMLLVAFVISAVKFTF
ncbi:uncharacterized protein [Choristoneura fumiferana]|uniref:uncharacterized protein n=1 Tax=Choristoneura fumiferana TaxID=7141 RepID=UPI003D15AB18